MGSHYETSGGVVTRYYLAGGTRVAMRKGSTFYWLLSDHLGSTSKVATAAGALHSQQLYKAWGESRYTSGTLPTRYTYTGQYSYASDFGLVFYGSRFYDPLLSRWTSPDSIIPQNQGTQAWDRYAYVNNSPLNYTDPTGHMVDDGCSTEGCSAKKGQDWHDYKYNVIYGNVDKKANAEKVEAVLNSGTSFALGIVAPPLGLFFSAIIEEDISSFDIALAFIPTSNLIPDNLSSYDDILKYAKEKYPKLADKINLHHITPKYLGGDPNGPVIALNAAYHQLITNEFRRLWEYGKGILPNAEKLQEIVDDVYSIFPLP